MFAWRLGYLEEEEIGKGGSINGGGTSAATVEAQGTEAQGAVADAILHKAAGDAREDAQGGAEEASGLGLLGVSSGPGESGGGPDHGMNIISGQEGRDDGRVRFGEGAGASLSTMTINQQFNGRDSAAAYAREMGKFDLAKHALDIAAKAGSTDAAIKLADATAGQREEDMKHESAQTLPQRLDTNRKAQQDMDKFVKECLNEFENELGEVSDEWELEDSVSDHISKILNICKPVCPNFNIDDYRGKFARLVRASLKKLQMGKEQFELKRAIELVNKQWAKGGGQKVCACTCMLCDFVSVCSCVYLVCTMSARVYI